MNGAGAISDTVVWIEQLLLGSLGSAIAVLAVAGVGLAMLSGQLPMRNGIKALLGRFLLLGAPTIATGIMKTVKEPSGYPSKSIAIPVLPPPIEVASPAPPIVDPYAGASIPLHRN